jgi:hypothetical protein
MIAFGENDRDFFILSVMYPTQTSSHTGPIKPSIVEEGKHRLDYAYMV